MAMTNPLQPVLRSVKIANLRPTQITVGMREVEQKRREWIAQRDSGGEFLGKHLIPAVIGPGKTYWIVDHHHLVRALYEEAVKEVLVTVLAKLKHLEHQRFFAFMDRKNWLHPYDASGEYRDWQDLPDHVKALADDPYRSLAGEVRRAGGYAKMPTPYTEFHWADFFRDRFRRSELEGDAAFGAALKSAIEMARSQDAAYLPGFAGPEADDKADSDD